MSSTHIIVFGANGRIGARLCALAASDPDLTLHAAVVRSASARTGRALGDDAAQCHQPVAPADVRPGANVIIDFSSPTGTQAAAELAARLKIALLVGTTGLSDAAQTSLRGLSHQVPVLLAPNTSLGVAVLADAAARVTRLLGPAFSASIVEAHHAMKKDAPSGTATRLAHAVRSAGGTLAADQVVAIRGGDVVGEHTIRFAGPGEYLELTHKATSRDLFVLGALRAAKWLALRSAPGWYSMENVLAMHPE